MINRLKNFLSKGRVKFDREKFPHEISFIWKAFSKNGLKAFHYIMDIEVFETPEIKWGVYFYLWRIGALYVFYNRN